MKEATFFQYKPIKSRLLTFNPCGVSAFGQQPFSVQRLAFGRYVLRS